MTDENTRAARALRLAAARNIITHAGEIALNYFSGLEKLTIERKTSGQDTVSEADRNVETVIRDAISKAFPKTGSGARNMVAPTASPAILGSSTPSTEPPLS